jgi:hypothetical protein
VRISLQGAVVLLLAAGLQRGIAGQTASAN